jgi:hypothetical protein
MMDPLLEKALSQLISALDALRIRHMVVGSLASSVHGVYRATADGDLLAAIAPNQVAPLVAALGPDWYADADAMSSAVRARRSFNVIHIPTAQKFDLFPVKTDFHAVEMDRAVTVPTAHSELRVASTEDTLLSKLQWYREGGEVSDRQWSDITGLIAANPALDLDYVRSWATRLRVKDLLARALADAARG